MSTFRTIPGQSDSGVSADGFPTNSRGAEVIIRHSTKRLTGTEIQNLGSSAQAVFTYSGRTAVPIGWHAAFTYAGGTAFSGNTTLLLYDTNTINTIGQATSAISGSANKVTVGTITATELSAGGLSCRINTGNPTGGHAGASLVVRVYYILI
jgi:hypothetical protein